MIAIDLDHLTKRLLAVLFERREVSFIRGIGAGIPVPFRAVSSLSPEAIVRPEDHTKPIARVGEGIVSSIGSASTYKDVLENPDRISKTVADATTIDSIKLTRRLTYLWMANGSALIETLMLGLA